MNSKSIRPRITVLVAPLDWGLGHATRCIPIIQLLLEFGCDVIIGGHGNSLALLRREFPSLKSIELPGYQPEYPRARGMILKMLRQLPHFSRVVRQEHKVIERVVAELAIDLVISDNRYGCWSSKARSVLITHQSNVLMPRRFGFLAPVVRAMINAKMRNFNAVWVPDVPGYESLAGELISFGKISAARGLRFIGHLSRFAYAERSIKYDVVAVCSGPEPQRSILEAILLPQLKESNLRFVLVRGVVEDAAHEVLPNGSFIANFLTSSALETVLQQGDVIIARSGYSTVMDLSVLAKKAIFIPTPGQTEQEYLAERLDDRGIAPAFDQDKFILPEALKELSKFTGFPYSAKDDLLRSVLQEAVQFQERRSNKDVDA